MSYNDLRKGRWSEPGREYLVTTVTRQRFPIFNDFSCARIFIRALARTQQVNRCTWLAWVLMPDHFHGLLRLSPTNSLAETMKSLKACSTRLIQKKRGATGSLWQPGFHDRALRKEDDRLAAARYVVANPLRAGLVRRLGDYPHWDSVWL